MQEELLNELRVMDGKRQLDIRKE